MCAVCTPYVICVSVCVCVRIMCAAVLVSWWEAKKVNQGTQYKRSPAGQPDRGSVGDDQPDIAEAEASTVAAREQVDFTF